LQTNSHGKTSQNEKLTPATKTSYFPYDSDLTFDGQNIQFILVPTLVNPLKQHTYMSSSIGKQKRHQSSNLCFTLANDEYFSQVSAEWPYEIIALSLLFFLIWKELLLWTSKKSIIVSLRNERTSICDYYEKMQLGKCERL